MHPCNIHLIMKKVPLGFACLERRTRLRSTRFLFRCSCKCHQVVEFFFFFGNILGAGNMTELVIDNEIQPFLGGVSGKRKRIRPRGGRRDC